MINLQKGAKVDLSKEAPGVSKFTIGCGWDLAGGVSDAYDLDASILMLTEGKLVDAGKNTIYYNNLTSSCGSIVHTGDNLTGEGDGDDETININLATIPAAVDRVVVAVDIYQAAQKNQNFGQVKNAYVRLLDGSKEVLKYDLSEDYSTSTAVEVCNIYRHNGTWKFEASGRGQVGGLSDVINSYS